jgi:predicted nucleic acid-binding protein
MAGGARGSVVRPKAFWDASALVPLCVRQGSSSKATGFYSNYEIAVWWATPVEIASAMARLLRTSSIQLAEWRAAVKIAATLSDTWSVIEPSLAIRGRAEQLVQRYDLRASGALQLGAALEWCGDEPVGQAFLTFDRRLFQAAMLSGFNAAGP